MQLVWSWIRHDLLQQRQLQFNFLFHLTFVIVFRLRVHLVFYLLWHLLFERLSVNSVDNLSFATQMESLGRLTLNISHFVEPLVRTLIQTCFPFGWTLLNGTLSHMVAAILSCRIFHQQSSTFLAIAQVIVIRVFSLMLICAATPDLFLTKSTRASSLFGNQILQHRSYSLVLDQISGSDFVDFCVAETRLSRMFQPKI